MTTTNTNVQTDEISMAYFDSIRCLKPSAVGTFTHSEFLEAWRELKHQPLAKKDDAPAFSMCSYTEGAGRKKGDIVAVHAIVLDVDEGVSWPQVGDIVDRAGELSFVVYSTYSSTPEKVKLRIILPLAKPVSPGDYGKLELAARAAMELGTPPIDPVSMSPAQLYFLPTCPPGMEEEHHVVVSDYSTPWTLEDLPPLRARAGGAVVGKHRSYGTETEACDGKRKDVYVVIDKSVLPLLNGVAPIFTEETFFLYEDGAWRAISQKELTKWLLVVVFKETKLLGEIDAMVGVMKVRYYKEAFPKRGDENRYLICLQNGTVEPLTGEVVPNAPENYIRTVLDYEYDQKAECRLWLSFLDQVFGRDPDGDRKNLLLQEYMGYLFITSTQFQKMLWLVGGGANGKSVINAVVIAMLGVDHVSTVPLDKLSNRFQTAELVGKLANVIDEVNSTSSFQDDILKQVVAGNLLQAERKNQHPFSFKPSVRIVAAMNELPRVKDSSHGFFRRLLLLQFNRTFQPYEQDKDLINKLQKERPGIFRWALEGLQRLMDVGDFTDVPSSRTALADYREGANPVLLFIRDRVEPTKHLTLAGKSGGQVKTEVGVVYRDYYEYCRDNGFSPKDSSQFGKEFAALGYKVRKSSGTRYYDVKLCDSKAAGINGMQVPAASWTTHPELRRLEDEMEA